jgi:RimJ/RimL family protein N-acetyltransferase
MKSILQTERLRLHEMTEADAENVYRLNRDPQVVKYVGEPPLTGVEQALGILHSRIFPQYRDHGVGRWAVVLKTSGAFIGWCGLRYEPEEDAYDLGFRFFQDQWGRGYATEAAQAVLDYGARNLPGARIEGKALVENVASIRVLEKIGMRFEGRGRDHDGEIAIYAAPRTTRELAPE